MEIKKVIAERAPRLVKSRRLELPISLISQLLHLETFAIERPINRFQKAMLIFSVDIDVGTKELGLINEGKNDRNVNKYFNECEIGEIEENAFPLLLSAFNSFKVPVTFALRGQLTATDNTFLPLLLKSPVKHDIGSHGYTHRKFQDICRQEAEDELSLLSAGMNKYGIVPKSFVFPRNAVSHLELLEEFGYECYREHGNVLNDGMKIERRGGLYDVHPGLYLTRKANVSLLKSLLSIAIEKRMPLHLWSHIWSFGDNNAQIKESIDNVLVPFLKYAKAKENKNLLQFETMLSASRKARSLEEDA